MLVELSIKNFAIIESLTVSFEKGLTVLTGETGAGKSIIMDAIHLLVGGRGSTDFIRYGEKKAEVEGLFSIDKHHPCTEKCLEAGIDISEGTIILQRNLSMSGKNVCRVNGKLVTMAILRGIGSSLVDIHGQHEHQQLMHTEEHLLLLDHYSGEVIDEALLTYRTIFNQYDELKKKLRKLTENEQQMVHRFDLLTFQLDEIQKANLELHEDEQLIEERNTIMNFRKIYDGLQRSYDALYGDHRGLDWLSLSMGYLEDVANVDDSLKEAHEALTTSYYTAEDVVYKLRDALERLEYDPNRLHEIEGRLNELNYLKRKYGSTVEAILEYEVKIAEEVDTIQNRESHVQHLQEELKNITSELLTESEKLTALRKSAAEQLIMGIHQELKDLYMAKAQFDIVFTRREGDTSAHFSHNGVDAVEFYISTNPGEPLKQLAKVASGGELSRVMLAVKSILSKHQGVTSIIFDEVDTGVSGRVAQAIAEKIYLVALDSQVLCISHLPQLAAMADTHLFIAKETVEERTRTMLTYLSTDEKVKEIGRMISGVEMTDLTYEHARELLHLAEKMKEV